MINEELDKKCPWLYPYLEEVEDIGNDDLELVYEGLGHAIKVYNNVGWCRGELAKDIMMEETNRHDDDVV